MGGDAVFYYGGKLWGRVKKGYKGRFDHTLGLWLQRQKQKTKVKPRTSHLRFCPRNSLKVNFLFLNSRVDRSFWYHFSSFLILHRFSQSVFENFHSCGISKNPGIEPTYVISSDKTQSDYLELYFDDRFPDLLIFFVILSIV